MEELRERQQKQEEEEEEEIKKEKKKMVMRKGPWTEQEDLQLARWADFFGDGGWTKLPA